MISNKELQLKLIESIDDIFKDQDWQSFLSRLWGRKIASKVSEVLD